MASSSSRGGGGEGAGVFPSLSDSVALFSPPRPPFLPSKTVPDILIFWVGQREHYHLLHINHPYTPCIPLTPSSLLTSSQIIMSPPMTGKRESGTARILGSGASGELAVPHPRLV